MVDRLLDSPRYGERWAQHWLDVVRYAETEGFEYDRHIPDAWRFRDYVIDSFNRDKPFDRFVIEQIAGDEIAPGDRECETASIFHRLGPVRRNAGNPDIALSRNEVLTERTDIIGTAFLGLTIGCARCHNHKLEPISQKDYYRLQAYLAATEEHDISLATPRPSARPGRRMQQDRSRARSRSCRRSRARRAEPRRHGWPWRSRRWRTRSRRRRPRSPPSGTTPAHRTPIHVLKRGVWENKGETVGPRPPSVLVPDDLPELPPDVPDPRTRLARWLASPDHPLTARVIVNRLWQHHFGTGLVKTVNDFGTKGDRPSHPELLDWLAATLVEDGWRLKPIHRLILLSSTYRQSSHRGSRPGRDAAARDDPENRLLWRFNRRRLEAEEIRDAMLAVSGRLNARAGGPSVMVPVDRGSCRLLYKPSQWQVARDAAEHDRRSIYLIAKRNLRLPFLEIVRRPGAADQLRAARIEHPRAPGAGAAQRPAGQRPGRGLRRPAPDGDGRRAASDGRPRLSAGAGPAPDAARGRPSRWSSSATSRSKEFTLALFNLNGFLYVP